MNRITLPKFNFQFQKPNPQICKTKNPISVNPPNPRVPDAAAARCRRHRLPPPLPSLASPASSPPRCRRHRLPPPLPSLASPPSSRRRPNSSPGFKLRIRKHITFGNLQTFKITTIYRNRRRNSTTKKKFHNARMLYLIGLGLGDERDITLRGLEAIKKCSQVYIEAYTSLLSFGITSDGLSKLEEVYGKPIIVADREMVEEKADDMLFEAQVSDVAFLVVGDPFGATTHSDLVVRAKKLGVDVKVVHNASVMNAIGVCGLQLYRYGETVSIPFFTDTWRPDSFYEKIKRNRELGLHTLCLLDIKVKEPSLESLCRGKKVYEPPRFMTINSAIEQLLEVAQNHHESVYNEDTTCVGLARVGCEDQVIVAGSMKQLLTADFGPPLHCLVIVGDTHLVEEEMLEFYQINQS